MQNGSTSLFLDITNWWRQQEQIQSKYPDLSNVAHDILSIEPHGVGVEASISIRQDVISWGLSKTTSQTLREKVVVRQYARTNNVLFAGNSIYLEFYILLTFEAGTEATFNWGFQARQSSDRTQGSVRAVDW